MRRVAAGFSDPLIQIQFGFLRAIPLIGWILRGMWALVVFFHLWGKDVANRAANSVSRSSLDMERLVDLSRTAGDERYRRRP